MSAEEPVPRVGPRVAETQLVALFAHLLPEVLLEDGVVVVTDHESGQTLAERGQLGQRGTDLMAPEGVQRGQRCGVERRHDEFVPVVDVVEAHAEQALLGGLEHHVVEGLLQGERAHVDRAVGVLPVVHREPQPVPLRRVGQPQAADRRGDLAGVVLLQAQHVGAVVLDEMGQLTGCPVLAQVVGDDLHGAASLFPLPGRPALIR